MDTVQSQYLGQLNAIVAELADNIAKCDGLLNYIAPVSASMPDSIAKLQAAKAAMQSQHDILAQEAASQSEIASQ